MQVSLKVWGLSIVLAIIYGVLAGVSVGRGEQEGSHTVEYVYIVEQKQPTDQPTGTESQLKASLLDNLSKVNNYE